MTSAPINTELKVDTGVFCGVFLLLRTLPVKSLT